mmetsp:Transcript_4501/g.10490  ORF Transcript_4501/g.10490 Transcript_4501/m.10490 type:complete len:262 (-) Transcript_4501:62-847(-)
MSFRVLLPPLLPFVRAADVTLAEQAYWYQRNDSRQKPSMISEVLREFGHGSWPCFFGEEWLASSSPDGRENGYGYRVCGLPLLQERHDCVVYSFGSNDEFDFEDAILARTGCRVRIFDPAPAQSQHRLAGSVRQVALGIRDGVEMLRWWAQSAPLPTTTRTLASLMQEMGDRHIDILKVDIEGAEHVLVGQAWPPVGQLLMEVHLMPRFEHDLSDLKKLVQSAEAAGLRLFHVDRPWKYCGSSCLLLSFIHRDFGQAFGRR